jgi:hypothetical protein
MVAPALVITPEEVAGRLQLPLPLADAVKKVLTEAIVDAQDDVQGYLGIPVTPQTVVLRNVVPRWLIDGYDGWLINDPYLIEVVSAVPQVDVNGFPLDLYTVTYTAGLDVANDPTLRPIKRYIKAAAQADPDVVQMWQEVTGIRGPVMNASTDGQSVTYQPLTRGGGGAAGSGAPGTLPTLESLASWRSHTAYQRLTYAVDGPTPWWW